MWETRRVITSKDVKFHESSRFACPLDIVVTNNVGKTHATCEEVDSPMDEEGTRVENDMYQPMEPTPHNVHRLKRQIMPTRRCIEECDYVAYTLTVASEVEGRDDSGSYKEAMVMIDASKWLGAMKQEIESLEKNGTWSIVKAPKNKRMQVGLQEERGIVL